MHHRFTIWKESREMNGAISKFVCGILWSYNTFLKRIAFRFLPQTETEVLDLITALAATQ
jgi:hypothetical protein